ncbi:extracellular solute-binding protein [Streptomyces sp. 846.5]|nr:extracellular solute-binding protein [Streptomyces sp. 846.5]
MTNRQSVLRRTVPLGAVVLCGAMLAACSGAGGGSAGSGGSGSVNVLMVNNPQMLDLQKLTAANFTKTTGIKVNFTVLPENDVRDKITQDFSSQAGQYDVATISNYETPSTRRTAGWPRSPRSPPATPPSTRATSCPAWPSR